jgi:hypothetical protein
MCSSLPVNQSPHSSSPPLLQSDECTTRQILESHEGIPLPWEDYHSLDTIEVGKPISCPSLRVFSSPLPKIEWHFAFSNSTGLRTFAVPTITVGVEASNCSLNSIGGVRISISTRGLLWKYVCRVPLSTTNPSWPLNRFLISNVWPLGTTISTSVVVLKEPRSAHLAPPTITYI